MTAMTSAPNVSCVTSSLLERALCMSLGFEEPLLSVARPSLALIPLRGLMDLIIVGAIHDTEEVSSRAAAAAAATAAFVLGVVGRGKMLSALAGRKGRRCGCNSAENVFSMPALFPYICPPNVAVLRVSCALSECVVREFVGG
eukprot:CAMPEP_0173106076 /NCGR_PEP_ID=MMETSP1102-20130122/40661_1 /TAXON_ID=49646 /ORGANISM="Geminigera sp., Strain Caron Lab Isolate" /LENGTH=142 /DNA_ID=CAMNT_0014002795 /DNA_START=137 /DNA_END=561 /DNA_ORIENTATION=+